MARKAVQMQAQQGQMPQPPSATEQLYGSPGATETAPNTPGGTQSRSAEMTNLAPRV